MKSIKIILSGAQGSGKTTLNLALSSVLNSESRRFKIIDSMSKKFFKKEDFADLSSQGYLDAQRKIYDFASKEYLEDTSFISSRGFADSYAYLKHSFDVTGKKEFADLIDLNYKNNRELLSNQGTYIFYVPVEFEIRSKDLRSTNKDFQTEIDTNIKYFLDKTSVYETVHGTVEQRVNQILEQLRTA